MSALDAVQRLAERVSQERRQAQFTQSQTLALIEQQAPGITADLSALSAVFGKFASVRIEAGAERLEIERKKISAIVLFNSDDRQSDIASKIGSNAWIRSEAK